MSSNGGGGIEVLAQVHRDSDARGDTALANAATYTLAVLTHRCEAYRAEKAEFIAQVLPTFFCMLYTM